MYVVCCFFGEICDGSVAQEFLQSVRDIEIQWVGLIRLVTVWFGNSYAGHTHAWYYLDYVQLD